MPDEITELIQIADVRVLVILTNYFFGSVFTADVLLNDRWSINLVLSTIDKFTRLETTAMRTEDLAEADKMATCSFLCSLLMVGFKYRQASAVLRIEAFFSEQLKSMRRELKDLKVSGKSDQYFKTYADCEKASDEIMKGEHFF